MSNERGQYGSRPRVPYVGISPGSSGPVGRSIVPWLVGGGVLAVVGFAAFGAYAARRPRLSAHEKEVSAWEAEFPGLPWYADQVKDSRQLDMWERARDYWERTH
jgi:hypothetical protein